MARTILLWIACINIIKVRGGIFNKCVYLVGINGGRVTYDDVTLLNGVGGRVNFVCNEGMRLVGAKTATCMPNEKWSSSPPKCKPKRCPHISGMNHGVTLRYNNTGGGTAKFECAPGYTLRGSARIKCNRCDFQWHSEPPKCEKCRPLVESFSNGRVVRLRDRNSQRLTFSCFEGYAMEGTDTIRCTPDLEWDKPVPNCICKKKATDCEQDSKTTCPTLISVANGECFTRGNRIGDVAECQCDRGFTMIGHATSQCTQGGQWSNELPHCVANSCPHVEQIENGYVEDDCDTEVLKIGCHAGFTPKTRSSLRCDPDTLTWEAEPKCVPLKCQEILTFKHGTVIGYSTEIGASFQWKCDPGFKMRKSDNHEMPASGTNRCLANREWDNKDVACIVAPVEPETPDSTSTSRRVPIF